MNSDDVFLSTPTTNKFDISKILNTKTITTTESTNFPSDNVLKRHNGAAIHLASPPTDEEQLSFEEPKLSADVLPSLDNYPTPPPVPRLPNLPTLPSFFRDEMPHSMHLPNSAPLTLSRTLPPVQMVSNSSNSGRSPSSPLKTPISAPQLSSSRHPTPIPRDDRRDLRYVPYAGNGYYEDIAYQNPSRMSMPGQAPRLSPNAYPQGFDYRSPHSPSFHPYAAAAHPNMQHMQYPGAGYHPTQEVQTHPSLAALDAHYYGVQQMKQQTRSKRQRPTPVQLRILKSVFNETFFPSSSTRQALSMLLGMPPRAVQVWFQNRRQQWRISHGSSEYEAGVRKMKVESGDVDLEKILFNLKLRDGGDANSPGVEEEETQSAGGPSYHSSPMMGHYDQ